jgi:hypothetical protein
MPTDPVRTASGRIAYHSRRDGNPAKLTEARRDLAAAKLERHIREAVAAAPPLSDDQKHRLAALLVGDKR